jgi:Na+/proline symporter
MFLVVGQIGFEAGKTGYFYGIAVAIGFIATTALVQRMRSELDEAQATTVLELLKKRFSTRVAKLFSLVTGLMGFFMAAGQFVGLVVFCRWISTTMTPSYPPWALAGLCAVALSFYPASVVLAKISLRILYRQVSFYWLCVV